MDKSPTETRIQIPFFIEHGRQGTYFTIPFSMPENTESFSLSYSYERHHKSENRVEHGSFISRKERSIIDLGLIAPDGAQVGASGSDKLDIFVSETQATPGYHPYRLVPGEWQIIVGAYKVADEGVDVLYGLSFKSKYLRLSVRGTCIPTPMARMASLVWNRWPDVRPGMAWITWPLLTITRWSQPILCSNMPILP